VLLKNFAFVEPFLRQSLYLSREKQPFNRVFSKNFFLVYRGAPVEKEKNSHIFVGAAERK